MRKAGRWIGQEHIQSPKRKKKHQRKRKRENRDPVEYSITLISSNQKNKNIDFLGFTL